MTQKFNIGEYRDRVTLQNIATTDESIVDLVTIWAKVVPMKGERLFTFEQIHMGNWFDVWFSYLQRVNYVAGDPIKYEGQQLTVHSLTEEKENTYHVTAYGTGLPAAVDALRGTKDSATDAGTAGQVAYDDDYAYICVVSGSSGNATWKKFPLHLC